MYYLYGMRVRGCSIGTQPKEGFCERRDDENEKYWDIIVYDRELSEEECHYYSLDFIKKED